MFVDPKLLRNVKYKFEAEIAKNYFKNFLCRFRFKQGLREINKY